MTDKKNISEFAIITHITHQMLLQQDDLKNVNKFNYFDDDFPCHIYLICRRPRILINPTNFHIDNEKIIFPFKIQQKDNFKNYNIVIPNRYGTVNFELNSNYPFNFFELKKDNEIILTGKSALLLQQFEIEKSNYLDLEVLYVGQSYGVHGARTAPDRLQNHSTLQSIYSDAIMNNPDHEIWLVLTSFERLLLTVMDGTKQVDEEENIRDNKRLDKVINTTLRYGLNEQQVINFTEAALIKYFQPTYNVEYKDTFPNPAHSTYKECYELDINTICVELNTEDLHCRLYSHQISPNWFHMPEFFLHSKEDRISMFEYFKTINKVKLIINH